MELRDAKHLACSEIRAASIVDCAGSWPFFKKVRAKCQNACLKREAVGHNASSLLPTSRGLTMTLINNTWQACVRDAAISSVAVNFSYAVLIAPLWQQAGQFLRSHFSRISSHRMLFAEELSSNKALHGIVRALYSLVIALL